MIQRDPIKRATTMRYLKQKSPSFTTYEILLLKSMNKVISAKRHKMLRDIRYTAEGPIHPKALNLMVVTLCLRTKDSSARKSRR